MGYVPGKVLIIIQSYFTSYSGSCLIAFEKPNFNYLLPLFDFSRVFNGYTNLAGWVS